MMNKGVVVAIVLGAGGAALLASAEEGGFFSLPGFGVVGSSHLITRPPEAAKRAPRQASTIWAVDRGVLVIDGDTGQLALVEREPRKATASLAIGADAGPLFLDEAAKRAYVVDRRRDRVVVVAVGAGLESLAVLPTRSEPVGLALAEGGATVLVTTAADGRLSAIDAQSGAERWSVEVGPEPRAVAVAPDGRRALVTLLRSSAVAEIDLAAETQPVRHLPLSPSQDGQESFARGAFAAAYLPDGTAVVPHQVMVPQQAQEGFEQRGSYGGGGTPPVAYQVAFLGTDQGAFGPSPGGAGRASPRRGSANSGVHSPRALAYDAARDTLFVAGYGSDDLIALGDASQASMRSRWLRPIADGCGPDGLAVAGDEIAVHCALLREVRWVDRESSNVQRSEPLGPSRLSDEVARGRDLFRRGNDARMSQAGALACESCHPEGGADGLSWRIEGHKLQTPFLGGRIAGTAPYKWDGGDKTLKRSLSGTIRRLGGSGLDKGDLAALAAWVEAIERPRAPARQTEAVARGQALFDGELGCNTCHGGALMTDGRRHDLADDLARVDTPSLLGLARSAPYYHDGSAETLRALLLENGNIHGMGRLSALPDDQIDDLVAYLESL